MASICFSSVPFLSPSISPNPNKSFPFLPKLPNPIPFLLSELQTPSRKLGPGPRRKLHEHR
ncbi:hypothetical protein CRYUN_Cryun24cG0097800 [Craigia yunnanensis]